MLQFPAAVTIPPHTFSKHPTGHPNQAYHGLFLSLWITYTVSYHLSHPSKSKYLIHTSSTPSKPSLFIANHTLLCPLLFQSLLFHALFFLVCLLDLCFYNYCIHLYILSPCTLMVFIQSSGTTPCSQDKLNIWCIQSYHNLNHQISAFQQLPPSVLAAFPLFSHPMALYASLHLIVPFTCCLPPDLSIPIHVNTALSAVSMLKSHSIYSL